MSAQRRWVTLSITVVSAGALVLAGASPASAAPIGLGEATSFSVLAGSEVTNTGPSVISGNVGVSPGTSVSGFFPAGSVTPPSSIFTAAAAAGPKLALTTAYNVAASAPVPPANVLLAAELGGLPLPLPAGNYTSVAPFRITGDLTLDGDANAVWIFKSASDFVTATDSRVLLTGGASSCNVFWQVTSSATLGVRSTMVGTVMALASITANTGTTVTGRLLAQTALVSLDNTRIFTDPACIEASSFSGPGGVPRAVAGPSLPVMGVDLPWLAWSLSLVAILAGATGVVVSATRRRAARS